MRSPCRVLLACCFTAFAGGCASPAEGDSPGALVVTAANAKQLIEARYTEQGRTIVLTSRLDGAVITSDILDERGRSISARADAVVQLNGSSCAPNGVRLVSRSQLFDDATQFATALRLGRHALRQLGDAMVPEASQSALFTKLSQQLRTLRNALTLTKLGILQDWGDEARRQISMTPEESTRFFALLNRHALMIGAEGKGKPIRAAATQPAPEHELEALLGAQRYAQYLAYRDKWMASNGPVASTAVPK
jgi:hypothetical protein